MKDPLRTICEEVVYRRAARVARAVVVSALHKAPWRMASSFHLTSDRVIGQMTLSDVN